MGLKAVVDSLDNVDEKYRDLYEERDGKFVLGKVEGLVTEADVQRVQAALGKERDEHRKTKESLKKFADLGEFDDVVGKLDRFAELETAAGGKIDEAKLNEMVEARIKTRLAPIEREKKTLADKLATAELENGSLKAEKRKASINEAVRKAATEAKMLPEAIEDALFLAERVFDINEDGSILSKDGSGYPVAMDPKSWMGELQTRRQHWWAPSQGGGGEGNNGGRFDSSKNPFSHDHWNLTEQGKLAKSNPSKAEQLAKAAGTSVGGPRPNPPKK